MYIFRRISRKDASLKLITGNKAFDVKSPNDNLEPYLFEDIISGGDYFTYLLIEQNHSNKSILLGLLRYKFINSEDFWSELSKCEVDQDIENNLTKELDRNDYDFIYLSRIGVIKNFQDMNVGQIISNFFEFLIKRKRKRCLVYLKVIERKRDFIAPSYDFIGKSDDKEWGNYFLASKILEFD